MVTAAEVMQGIRAPLHIALISKTNQVSAAAVAFIAAAITIQLREHVCPAWGLPPVHVAAYSDDVKLPPELAAVIYLVDTDGNPDSLGYHATIADLVYAFVDVTQTRGSLASISAVTSHEAIELVLNAYLDAWIPVPFPLAFEPFPLTFDGVAYQIEYWREGADPVQELTYPIETKIGAETREIRVSDFVLPAWFVAAGPSNDGPGDFLGQVRPLQITPGGFQVARRSDGKILWLPEDSEIAAQAVAQKFGRVLSRLSRAGSILRSA